MPEVRLIDANALHAKILEENRRNYAATENVAQILLRIETAPTIKPEVRHGRWIEDTSRGSYSIYCSYCGSHKETICPSDYCPDCGARMDRGVDDANKGG